MKVNPAESERGEGGSALMSTSFVVLLLSLLLGLQPVTTDLYLPALPTMTEVLAGSMSQAQLTLSGLLLAFGLSQLLWGPLSDRFGRRPVLLLGLGSYTLAGIGCVIAPNMEVMLSLRIIQGAAMGAVVMCGRALVRDLYSPEIGARTISKGLSGLGVIAIISLPLGGQLAQFFGWRITLGALVLFGGVTLYITARHFVETLHSPNPDALQPLALLRTWKEILCNRSFQGFALLGMTSYGGLFTMLAASSFVFINILGETKASYGAYMLTPGVAYLFGTVVCRRLLHRFGVHRTVAIGGACSAVGGSLVGLVGLAEIHNVWAILVPFYLYMIGHGINQPCSQAGAVGPFPHAAGAASAWSGCLMMLSAFGMGIWLGQALGDSHYPLTNGIWFWGVMTAVVAWGLVARVAPAQAKQPE